jgi:hypothetical protein
LPKNAGFFWKILARSDAIFRPIAVRLKINGRKLPEAKEHLLERFFVMLVAAGVAGEVISTIFSLHEIAELNGVASAASERAAIVESNNLVLRSNVVALELKLQPRTISPSQHERLVRALALGPKGPVFVQSDWTDTEASLLAGQIRSALVESGYEEGKGSANILSIRSFGILMFVKDVTNAPSHAVFIQNVFRTNGVFMDGKNAQQTSNMEKVFEANSNLVLIWVSAKPTD